ncbi:MAG: hypothetical protein ACO3RX_02560 [Chthoniobacterales bacterium]|jgi:hypothetical protein
MRTSGHDNALPLGPMMRWLVLVVFVGLLGLCYVHMKHKLKVDGDKCRDLEAAIAALDEKLKVAGNEVMRLTSRPELERRRQEGWISMIEVQDSRLNRLRVQTTALAAQPVGRETDGEVFP